MKLDLKCLQGADLPRRPKDEARWTSGRCWSSRPGHWAWKTCPHRPTVPGTMEGSSPIAGERMGGWRRIWAWWG